MPALPGPAVEGAAWAGTASGSVRATTVKAVSARRKSPPHSDAPSSPERKRCPTRVTLADVRTVATQPVGHVTATGPDRCPGRPRDRARLRKRAASAWWGGLREDEHPAAVG